MSADELIQDFIEDEWRSAKRAFGNAKHRPGSSTKRESVRHAKQVSDARFAYHGHGSTTLLVPLIVQRIEQIDVKLIRLWAEVIANGENVLSMGKILQAKKGALEDLLDYLQLKEARMSS